MRVNYDKLWKLMIDKNINKTKLSEKAGITTNEMVKMETLVRICKVLECTLDDIVEMK